VLSFLEGSGAEVGEGGAEMGKNIRSDEGFLRGGAVAEGEFGGVATYQFFEQKEQIALERLVNISIALSRTGEIENLFSPMPIRSVDELSPKTQRLRGKWRQ
jgi:hypothetical protein